MKPDKRSPVDIDAAIDRAVRSIMSAEPRAGMRQRVLSRINEAPRRAWPILRLAIAGGAIAAMAVIVTSRVGDRPLRPESFVTSGPTSGPAPSPRETPPVRQPRLPAATAPPPRRSSSPSQVVPRGLVVAQSLPPLEAEDPVRSGVVPRAEVVPELQRLQVPALSDIQEIEMPMDSVPPITMPPIGISNLQPIAPLQGSLR